MWRQLSSSVYLLCGLAMLGTCLLQSKQSSSSTSCSNNQLRKLNIVNDKYNLSGLSSGASFTHQIHVAFSKKIHTVGLFLPIFYTCAYPRSSNAEDSSSARFTRYRNDCSYGAVSVNSAIELARSFEKDGRIDNLTCLANARVFLYVAKNDELAQKSVRTDVAKFYEAMGTPKGNINVTTLVANHHMPTDKKNQPSCRRSIYVDFLESLLTKGKEATTGCAYCAYDGAYWDLHFTYNGNLKRPTGNETLQPLLEFDQCPFLEEAGCPNGCKLLDCTGYIYIPAVCNPENENGEPCHLHVIFHGSHGSRSLVGTDFVYQSGYLEVCEANNFVCMFPQATMVNGTRGDRSSAFDITGYTSFKEYPTNRSCQMKAILKMLEAVTGRTADWTC